MAQIKQEPESDLSSCDAWLYKWTNNEEEWKQEDIKPNTYNIKYESQESSEEAELSESRVNEKAGNIFVL